MAQQHQPVLVRRQFHDNDTSVEDAMLVQLSKDKRRMPTPWREAYIAPAVRPFVLQPEVWELNTNRAIATADPTRRHLDFEMTAHGDLLMSLTLRAKAPSTLNATNSPQNGLITYPPALILAMIHRAELWVGHTLVERLEPEYIHIWQRLACRLQPKEAQGRVGDQTHHDSAHSLNTDQYVLLPFFFYRGQSPLPIQKVRDNCGGRLGGPEGGIRVRVYLRDLKELCPSLSRDPTSGNTNPPQLLTTYDDFDFQLIGKTALLGDDEARHVRKADFSTVVPHVESLHHDEEGDQVRPSHQMTELILRVERPVTRLIWAVRDKHILPDSQGNHTYSQGIRKLAGPPINPLLGDFNVYREGSSPTTASTLLNEIIGPTAGNPDDIITISTGIAMNNNLYDLTNNAKNNWVTITTPDNNLLSPTNPIVLDITPNGSPPTKANRLVFWWRNNNTNIGIFPKDLDIIGIDAQNNETVLKQVRNFSQDDVNTSVDVVPTDANATLIVDWQSEIAYSTYRVKFLQNNYGDDAGETGVFDDRVIFGEIALRNMGQVRLGSTDLKTSRHDMRPGSLHLWGDRFDFRTTDEQGTELVDPIEDVQLKLDGQDRFPDDSEMRASYYRLIDPYEHASRSMGQQPGVYTYTFARHADSLSREGINRAVTGSINLGKVQDKVLRLKHRVRDREAVLFVWAECLNIFEMGNGYGSYGMRYS